VTQSPPQTKDKAEQQELKGHRKEKEVEFFAEGDLDSAPRLRISGGTIPSLLHWAGCLVDSKQKCLSQNGNGHMYM